MDGGRVALGMVGACAVILVWLMAGAAWKDRRLLRSRVTNLEKWRAARDAEDEVVADLVDDTAERKRRRWLWPVPAVLTAPAEELSDRYGLRPRTWGMSAALLVAGFLGLAFTPGDGDERESDEIADPPPTVTTTSTTTPSTTTTTEPVVAQSPTAPAAPTTTPPTTTEPEPSTTAPGPPGEDAVATTTTTTEVSPPAETPTTRATTRPSTTTTTERSSPPSSGPPLTLPGNGNGDDEEDGDETVRISLVVYADVHLLLDLTLSVVL